MSLVKPTKLDEPIPALIKRGRPVKKMNGDILKNNADKNVTVIPPMPEGLRVGEWSEQAIKVLKERYLLKDNKGETIETPDQMCWRVSWDIALAEANFGHSYKEIEATAKEYYDLLVSHEFLPNSPTLANAGKNNGLQYSACFVIPVEDSIEGIFDGIKWQALIHKSGGGTGFSFSRLRQSGAIVGSTKGIASGPVSFMKVYDAATEQVKQGGMRRGANMGILRVDHPDITQFIHCKESGGITNFNISVAVTDVFMKAYMEGTNYDLIDPKTKEPVGQLDARKVMEDISQGAWQTGDPGIVFIDRINEGSGNPVSSLGPIESTNPCGEQPLYPFDVCNLGSIFLTYFIKDNEVDWNKLEKAVKTAVKFLDSVIERNPYTLPQIKEMATKIRRIGLGVAGWADMLATLDIKYDSPEALVLAEKIMKFVNTKGHEASQELAVEREPFPLWEESVYRDSKPIRNSTITTIAPTGTIGIVANASTGVEPFFAIAFKHYVKTNALERTMYFFNPLFEKMAQGQSWYTQEVKDKIVEQGSVAHIDEIPQNIKDAFRTAHDISYEWHVKMQAAFQKYTDNAVSKTINLPNDATREDIKNAYVMAYETGCKGITVYRDGCKNIQVLNVGTKEVDKDKKIEDGKRENGISNGNGNGNKTAAILAQAALTQLRPRPVKLIGATYRSETPVGHAFVTINSTEDGQPFEVFINVGHAGTDVAADAEAIGRLISMSLRIPSQLTAREVVFQIVDQLRGIGGSNHIGFGINRIKSLADALAKILEEHTKSFPEAKEGIKVVDNGTTDRTMDAKLEDGNKEIGGGTESIAAVFKQVSISAKKRDLCPSCGAAAFVLEEGCAKCYACGFSKC